MAEKFFFYIGVVQLSFAGLPLTSCFWIIGPPSVGGSPKCPFLLRPLPGLEPRQAQSEHKCQRLNDISHPEPLLNLSSLNSASFGQLQI